MKIGDMDTRVELHSPSTTTDSFGQPVVAFTLNSTVWAKRFDRVGGEVVVGDRVVSVVRTEVGIRYKSGVDETWQLKIGGVGFRIDAVLTVGRNRFMKILCSRRDD